MGNWLNLAFIQSADTCRVEQELSRLLTEGGRRLTTPKPRTPELYDRMQYGLGDEVQRWGVAGFQGAPGWTVLRTAPFQLLMQGSPSLLARLAARLGVPAFQYNLYDSSPDFLMEVDADGRVELSGFVGSDLTRYWGGEPPHDRLDVRFRIIDPSAVASWSESAMPNARVSGWLPSSGRPVPADPAQHGSAPETPKAAFKALRAQQEADLWHWLEEIGADIDSGTNTWRTHPAHVVRRLARAGGACIASDGGVDQAIMTVFGGPNSWHCDNDFLVQTLIPHAPMPVAGFVLYADAPGSATREAPR